MAAEEQGQVRIIGANVSNAGGYILPDLLWTGRVAARPAGSTVSANIGRVDHGVKLPLQTISDVLVTCPTVRATAMIEQNYRTG